ncbi:MAG: DUF1002 domain-containing protein [Finegoldia sp.]|nr:DUF1002 domain-containing protein [Finegoldia sp.]
MKKILSIFLTALVVFSSNIVQASKINTDVIDERWGKPTFVYGDNLDKDQVYETMKLLDINSPDNVKSIPVTHDDLLYYIGGDQSNPGNMVSSVLVKKEAEGKGIKVEITTPKNITLITDKQYENAALTAGVKDASIMVAAIRPVTGESALTGVFKAFDSNGEKLDKERIEIAQDELDLVGEINQENEDKTGFDKEKFNDLIVIIKDNIANITINNNGDSPSLEEIKKVVNDAIAESGLEQSITQDQVQQLIDLFEKYTNSNAINPQEIKSQLAEISSKIGGEAKNLYEKAESSGLIDQIIEFFQSLIESIARTLKGLN